MCVINKFGKQYENKFKLHKILYDLNTLKYNLYSASVKNQII